MGDTVYIWGAHSRQLNQTIHELNLGQKMVEDKSLAQKFADSFATRLNNGKHLHVNDWQPKVERRNNI